MKTRAAVLWGQHQKWSIEEVTLEPPKAGEVLVNWKVAGLCHSDEHVVTGDMSISNEVAAMVGAPEMFPIIGGHEGAGIVVEVGPGVTDLAPGDHVSASFVPSCGRCRYCASGRQNLCDLGAGTMQLGMITDGTPRAFVNGQPMKVMAKVGSFAEHNVVAEASLVKVANDLPFPAVALVSCGVATGYGSAVKRAAVKPGDTVVVVGIGGIGINAVQGAKLAGARRIVAVDPIEFKRNTAMDMGATHVCASMAEAIPLVTQLTWGQMADQVIMTPDVLRGEMMTEAMTLTGKGATCVVTAISPMSSMDASINLFQLAMWEKEVKGTIFGSLNPRADIPMLLGLYRDGLLKLDELVTSTYTLDQINDGYQDLLDGKNIRGVIIH